MKEYKVNIIEVSATSHREAEKLLNKYARAGYILKAVWSEPAGESDDTTYNAATCFAFERDKIERRKANE